MDYQTHYESAWRDPAYHENSPELRALPVLQHLCATFQPDRVMSFGCGSGRAIRELLQAGWDAYGIDIAANALDADFPKDRVHITDVLKLEDPPFGSCDLVFSIDVLEHIMVEDLPAFMRAITVHQPRVVYLEIATEPDIGPVERNLHVCVRPAMWWHGFLSNHFRVCDVQTRERIGSGCRGVAFTLQPIGVERRAYGDCRDPWLNQQIQAAQPEPMADVCHPAKQARLFKKTVETVAAKGVSRLVLYGAGRHTRRLLQSGSHDSRIVAIVDDDEKLHGSRLCGLPIIPADRVSEHRAEAVVVSSDAYESTLVGKARDHWPGMPVFAIYGNHAG